MRVLIFRTLILISTLQVSRPGEFDNLLNLRCKHIYWIYALFSLGLRVGHASVVRSNLLNDVKLSNTL